MKKLATLTTWIIFTLLLFHFSLPVGHAQILQKQNNRTYQTQEEFISITEQKSFEITQNNFFIGQGSTETFTIFFPIANDPNQDEKIDKTLNSVTITDSDGRDLDYSVEQENNSSVVIGVQLPRDVTFFNPYELTLSYNAYGLLVQTGAIKDIYIPAFAESYVFENEQFQEIVTTTVAVPKTFGDINFVTVPAERGDDTDNWYITINQNDIIGTPAWIQVGTTQYYEFNLEQPYVKTSNLPYLFNTITLPIPRDIQSGPITQTVFYDEFSEAPHKIYEDINGNLLAEFRVPANQSGTITFNGYIEINQQPNFSTQNWGTIDEIDSSALELSTQPAEFWEVDHPEIQQVASELSTSSKVYDRILSTYNYVIDQIDYSTVKLFGINERQGALETLRGGAAVCMEYSDLFIALMRAQGIPARAAFGYGYSTLDYESEEDETVNHQWAEVYVPGLDTWIAVDTTWGDGGPELIGGDLNHVYFHVATQDPNTPSSTEKRYVGTLENIPERITRVDARSTIPNGRYQTSMQLQTQYTGANTVETIIASLTLGSESIGQQTEVLGLTLGDSEQLAAGIVIQIIVLLVFIIFISVLVNNLLLLPKVFGYTKGNGARK